MVTGVFSGGKEVVKAAEKAESVVEKVHETLSDPLSLCFDENQTCYFYLVDEIAMETVVPFEDEEALCPFPLEIKVPGKFVSDHIGTLRMTLKAAKAANGLAGVAKIFGYDFTDLTESMKATIEEAIGQLDRKSSVEEFTAVQAAKDSAFDSVKDAEAQAKALRGNALRDLRLFFEEQEQAVNTHNDTKKLRPDQRIKSVFEWCGLQRVMLPTGQGKGAVVYTHPDNVDKLNKEAENEANQ